MSEGPIRDAAVRVAKDPAAMMEGFARGEFPFDYHDAIARQRASKE
jgi:hypothetical protein